MRQVVLQYHRRSAMWKNSRLNSDLHIETSRTGVCNCEWLSKGFKNAIKKCSQLFSASKLRILNVIFMWKRKIITPATATQLLEKIPNKTSNILTESESTLLHGNIVWYCSENTVIFIKHIFSICCGSFALIITCMYIKYLNCQLCSLSSLICVPTCWNRNASQSLLKAFAIPYIPQ